MISNNNLNRSNFNLYAAQNYNNPRALDVNEFYEDLYRFKYLKKLFTKYEKSDSLQERLILNHLILIYNVFKFEAATSMCFFKIGEQSWPALKTFLLFLSYIKEDDFINIPSDLYVAKKLQQL
jgi:hypothetical protein|tara:strand:- start:1093 stop:1461 length:369 start_codon:yes stop_codon:yes gene_type:complete